MEYRFSVRTNLRNCEGVRVTEYILQADDAYGRHYENLVRFRDHDLYFEDSKDGVPQFVIQPLHADQVKAQVEDTIERLNKIQRLNPAFWVETKTEA